MTTASDVPDRPAPAPLSNLARAIMLVVAFSGWFCAGFHMSITQLGMRAATIDLLSKTGRLDLEEYQTLSRLESPKKAGPGAARLSLYEYDQLEAWKTRITRWCAWYTCAFLFGAATGGWLFGWLGDRIGRSKGMALSILTYSGMAGAAWFAQTPEQLLVLWFLACTGVGGMWPTGVALVSEAWSSLSRPVAAGIIGTSANIGIFVLSTVATQYAVTEANWRWLLLVGAAPFALGIFSLLFVAESPRWLAARQRKDTPAGTPTARAQGVFRPPLLQITLLAILLATIPIIGGWGSANWMVFWADKAGEQSPVTNYTLKAEVLQARAITGVVGSLIGGWIASLLGRRLTYFLASLFALVAAQYTFWRLTPLDPTFLYWVSALGFFSGIYFGWLPLCLPELFPTHVRSTGAGIGFNFGRILTAVTVFATGALTAYFGGDYAKIGRVTSLIFAVGMIAIWLVPSTNQGRIED